MKNNKLLSLKKIILFIIFLFVLYFIFKQIKSFLQNRKKENFKNGIFDSVPKSDIQNQMFNPYANFINIGDTKNTGFRGFNAPLSDPKPLKSIKLNLDKTIVISNITYNDIKPIINKIEEKGKNDMDKLLIIGIPQDYFYKSNYIKKISNNQIAVSNSYTYHYPLNYTTKSTNIYQTEKSKLPQLDSGNNFIFFMFIEYFRGEFPKNFQYISILRYKVLDARIDRNLNYYYKVQADYYINTNYTIWTLEYDFFMIKKDFELNQKNLGSYIPIILSCKYVGNYFQDSLFLQTGYSPFNYNYGTHKGETIDNPYTHQFIYNTENLKSNQFVGIDENFTGSGPNEATNVGNLDKNFVNMENPKHYSKNEYIKQIVNTQNQSILPNQYACFNINNNNMVFDIYSFNECERDYDDYFRIKPKGIFDKQCRKNEDCPFFENNTNYPNKRGVCNRGYCELPSGLLPLGYHYYLSKTKPLCYNCFTKEWLPITNLHTCCEEQKDRNKYPFLSSPDYAFKNDILERTNYYNNKYCSYYPNRNGKFTNNIKCIDNKIYYNI